MASRKLLADLLRRSRRYHSLRPLQSTAVSTPDFPPLPVIPLAPTTSRRDRDRQLAPMLPLAVSFRYFSSSSPESGIFVSSDNRNSVSESELQSDKLSDASGISHSDAGLYGDVECFLPIDAVVCLLDRIHDFTGLPWWMTIASSTLMLRFSLFPFLLFQLHKLKKIGECIPKLPLPFPPPLSGKSYIKQFSHFRRERKAMGCPSFLWFLAYISVQMLHRFIGHTASWGSLRPRPHYSLDSRVPCFFLCMASVRRMSLDHHAGFETGGTLWFQNLTEYSHGAPGLIFPTLIAGLHLLNVQISLKTSKVDKDSGLLGLLAKLYKIYLKALTVPIFVTGFFVPHGSLVYWVTNSSLNVIQHMCLQSPDIREKLGLPRELALSPAKGPESLLLSEGPEVLDSPREVPVKDLSPKELVALSVVSLSRGNKDEAVPLLRLALDKDPDYVRALTIMGQTLLQKRQEADAIEFLERAISKICGDRLPTEVEDVDLLIQASQWAGVAYIRQGKLSEGRAHLERAASVEEPDDEMSKAHYYDGFVLLASALVNEGRKAEAIKYLQKAAVYNPEFNAYLEQCEKDSYDLIDDLESSRRRDY